MLGRAVSRLLWVSLLTGCGDDPYVIGRFVDTGCAERPDAIFCSGFERPDLSEWDQTVVVNRAQVSQTEGMKRSGLLSCRCGCVPLRKSCHSSSGLP